MSLIRRNTKTLGCETSSDDLPGPSETSAATPPQLAIGPAAIRILPGVVMRSLPDIFAM
jgi:hypothetical protein